MIDKVYEDNEILVVNKPSGLVVNRSETTKDKTLQDFLEESGIEVERAGIVHRLDKDTSGLLVVAKTKEAFDILQDQFKERLVEKEYTALVHGFIKEELIDIEAPIKRNPKNPLKNAVVSDGKPAHTRVEKIKTLEIDDEKYTFIVAKPRTGRTHQIRVHLSALNHPIVHDPIYCTRKLLEGDSEKFDRMMLHSTNLAFFHPKSGKKVTFVSNPPKAFDL